MNITENYYTPIQLRLPVDYTKIIDINDPVYTFIEVLNHVDLNQYFVEKDYITGRPKYDSEKLLKVVLFAFMESGYISLRDIEKLCKTDIRFMWILDDMRVPSYATIGNFIKYDLKKSVPEIMDDMNSYIFKKENVDLNHVYIDGTKVEANANKYTWVWKKACTRSRAKLFVKLTDLIDTINECVLSYYQVKFETREEYAIDYLEVIRERFLEVTRLDTKDFVYGKGKRKTPEQRYYDLLVKYTEKLKTYAEHISTCGEHRNSYSKTDNDATFMRVKCDYMGNDQLLPAYNFQAGVCDGYVAVYDVFQYASDMDCFQPLMTKFHDRYGFWPEYPVADAGYGSYNNYLFCEQHEMKKYMKFTMFNKEMKDKKYHNDPYRAVNFKTDENGNLVCPEGRKFNYLRSAPVRGNQYGRTQEYYQCENCDGCEHKTECHKGSGNRIISINEELTSFHEEVLGNLNSIHGALLRMNRSIQSEGAFGTIKWNHNYKRLRRRGFDDVMMEFGLICIGFNLHKYHLSRMKMMKAA